MNIVNEMKLDFPSCAVNEGFARMVISAFVLPLNPTLEELGDIKTSVSEAVTNCIVHAYPDKLGNITLRCRILKDNVLDIVVKDSCAYLFLKEDIAEYVTDSLTRVRHTDVKLSTVESVPEGELYRTEQKRIQLSGERLDATIAKVFGISREDSSRLFAKSLVYVGGRVTENTSYAPKVGDIITVKAPAGDIQMKILEIN